MTYPKKIGLTGSVASGKSTIAKLLRAKGYAVLDADVVARGVTEQPQTLLEIANTFGPEYVTEGRLERGLLAQHVFGNPAELSKLNAIVHPKVRTEMHRLERESRGTVVFQDIPLLFESALGYIFDQVWVVDAPVLERLERAKIRSSWTEAEFWIREKAQMPIAEKKQRATQVLINDRDLAALEAKLNVLLEGIGEGKRV
jgi:dephospho-CoA kinase